MIVFGHNNFKIKTLSSRELNIPKENGQEDIEIQVRQKYAHLFWIPFFPIGKIWAFKRKGDSTLYELPETIKERIKDRYDIKTPWYSFSLIILAALGFSGFLGMEKLNDIKWENNFYQEQAEQQMMVKYPTTGDFYAFTMHNDADTYKSTGVILKVNSYTDTTIEFTAAYQDLYAQNISSYSIDSEIKKSNAYVLNAININKTDLLKLVTSEYRDYDSRKLQLSAFDNKYVLFKKMKRKALEKL